MLSLRVGGLISDHALIRFVLPLKKPSVEAQWVTSRAWRRLSRDALRRILPRLNCAQIWTRSQTCRLTTWSSSTATFSPVCSTSTVQL